MTRFGLKIYKVKILLLGHNGYLGSYLYKHLSADILEKRNVYDNEKKYDYVINCIGSPSIEFCEEHITETNYSNWLVVEDIKKYYPKSKIINFSSYYVYDDDGLCNENSNTTDKYAYTRQKLNSEKSVINGVTFRLGKLFGNPYQKQNKLVEYIFENDNLVLDTVLFNPTSVEQVLIVIEYELRRKNMAGIYNLSNLGFTSPYELGIFINNIFGTEKKITKIEKMNRSFHNYGRFLMDVSKLNSECLLTDWKEYFIEYVRINYSELC